MLLKILQVIGIIVAIFLLYFTMILVMHGQILASIIVSFFLGLSISVFIKREMYPLRYLYPSLVTFILFLLFPSLLSIVVAFTNYGIGHLYSFNDAYQNFLQQTIEENYSIKLQQSNNNDVLLLVKVKGIEYIATVSPHSKFDTPIYLTVNSARQNFSSLKFPAILKICEEKLSKYNFILANEETAKIVGAKLQINKGPKYRKGKDEFSLVDNETQKVYVPNYTTGFFSNGEENLYPGFIIFYALNNFKRIFSESFQDFTKIFIWNVLFALFSVFGTFSIGLFFALLLQNKMRFKLVYRVLFIIPYSIPFFISVLIFKGFFNTDFGIINDFLNFCGISDVPWLDHKIWAKISCILVNFWLGIPYMFLITTGILQSIPNSIYETAILDGVGIWKKVTKITLPLILPPILPLLLGSFAFNFNNFAMIYLLTGGNPADTASSTTAGHTDILLSWVYKMSFTSGQQYGLGSALTIIIFAMLIGITIIQYKMANNSSH